MYPAGIVDLGLLVIEGDLPEASQISFVSEAEAFFAEATRAVCARSLASAFCERGHPSLL